MKFDEKKIILTDTELRKKKKIENINSLYLCSSLTELAYVDQLFFTSSKIDFLDYHNSNLNYIFCREKRKWKTLDVVLSGKFQHVILLTDTCVCCIVLDFLSLIYIYMVFFSVISIQIQTSFLDKPELLSSLMGLFFSCQDLILFNKLIFSSTSNKG